MSLTNVTLNDEATETVSRIYKDFELFYQQPKHISTLPRIN